jgi:hypothetical protein
VESPIARPERRVLGEHRRGEQLRVDVADAESVQLASSISARSSAGVASRRLWEMPEQSEDLLTAPNAAERELAEDPRVRQDDAPFEQLGQRLNDRCLRARRGPSVTGATCEPPPDSGRGGVAAIAGQAELMTLIGAERSFPDIVGISGLPADAIAPHSADAVFDALPPDHRGARA